MRCYNGCPDAELQALIDDSRKADEELAAIGARAVYYPMEGAWLVARDTVLLTGFHESKRSAANAALSDAGRGTK